MDSEPSHLPESLLEQLINNSRNMAQFPIFLPFILGLANIENNSDSPQDSSTQTQERVVLINPLTQSMVVIQTSDSANLESFFRGLFVSKDGQPPASKASIEAMPSVEIKEDNCEGECVICLENWEVGQVAKEMPCKHMFHGGCIEKWLKIHGSCPVCRFNMPAQEVEDFNKNSESEDRFSGREIRVSFSFGSDGRSQNSDSDDESSDS